MGKAILSLIDALVPVEILWWNEFSLLQSDRHSRQSLSSSSSLDLSFYFILFFKYPTYSKAQSEQEEEEEEKSDMINGTKEKDDRPSIKSRIEKKTI